MSDWKDILKESRLTSQTGIRTKLGTTPLTMGDEDEDDFPCCEEAREKAISLGKELGLLEIVSKWEHIDCEGLFWAIDNFAIDLTDEAAPKWGKINDEWQKCIFAQDPTHKEQKGWYVDYREL